MAASRNAVAVVIEQNIRYQATPVDDADELPDIKRDRSASSPTAVSATSEDYVEERYKVDRRKLEQMIQGKRKQNNGYG